MKVSFKLGAISVSQNVPANDRIISSTRENGVLVSEEKVSVPAKIQSFSLEASEYSLEYEKGELAEVYQIIVPLVKDLIKEVMSGIAVMKKGDREAMAEFKAEKK